MRRIESHSQDSAGGTCIAWGCSGRSSCGSASRGLVCVGGVLNLLRVGANDQDQQGVADGQDDEPSEGCVEALVVGDSAIAEVVLVGHVHGEGGDNSQQADDTNTAGTEAHEVEACGDEEDSKLQPDDPPVQRAIGYLAIRGASCLLPEGGDTSQGHNPTQECQHQEASTSTEVASAD